MRISYRITSWIVLGACLLVIVSAFIPSLHNKGDMWMVSYGPMHDLHVLVNVGAFVVFLIQGFRNRSGPRWLAIAGIISLVLLFEEVMLDFQDYRPYLAINSEAIISYILYGCTAVMYLHHALRPRDKDRKWPKTYRLGALAYRVVTFAFLFMMAAWFVISHIVLLSHIYTSENAITFMDIWPDSIGWPAYPHFFLAIALTTYRSKVVQPE